MPSALADPRISAKQAQVRQVLARIDQLDQQLGRAVEAYDGATYRLGQIRADLSVNRHDARVVRTNLTIAQQRLALRLRYLYMWGGPASPLEVLLSVRSLGEFIDSLDSQKRISSDDMLILGQVKTFRAELAAHRLALDRAQKAQAQLVAQRAADKVQIEQGLRTQQGLLASIHSEIVRLRRQDAARQAELLAQARARLGSAQGEQARVLSSIVNGLSVSAPSSPIGQRVVAIALRYLGLPYVWAAAGPDAFDCSGLVMYVFAQVGISLPHFAAAQWTYGVYVSRDQLEPGDLVFFDNLGHVGIYVGNGDFIEAPQPGDVVKITPLSDPWANANYYGAKRIIP